MDRNSAPYQEPSVDQSISDTKLLISHIRSLSPSSPLVHPILTPRFAISCTPELLTSLGSLAASDPTLAIQTHISENQKEIEFTKELFPKCATYTDVYKHFGLLGERTILAHAVHLSDGEMGVVKECGAGVSHCPTSNFYLNSGVARVGEMLDRGIKVSRALLFSFSYFIDKVVFAGRFGYRLLRWILPIHSERRPRCRHRIQDYRHVRSPLLSLYHFNHNYDYDHNHNHNHDHDHNQTINFVPSKPHTPPPDSPPPRNPGRRSALQPVLSNWISRTWEGVRRSLRQRPK